MVHGKGKKVPFRRRREGKTNYRKRLALLKSGLPRLVVRKTLRYTIAQVVEFDMKGDRVIVGRTTKSLSRFGWTGSGSNISAAYLLGYYIGMELKKKGIDKVILDAGLVKPTKGGKIFAVVRGVRDAGVEVPCDEEYLPSDDIISGKHFGEDRVKLYETVKSRIEGEAS